MQGDGGDTARGKVDRQAFCHRSEGKRQILAVELANRESRSSWADGGCLQELRWLYDRRGHQEAQRDLAAWTGQWSGRYPKLVDWGEQNIGETLTFYRRPRQHHKHLKSTNMLERLNEAIKRRTRGYASSRMPPPTCDGSGH